MSQIKFELEYEHLAYLAGPNGQRIIVGKVLVYEENFDKKNNVCSVLVELADNLPEDIRVAIEKEPRILKFVKSATRTSGVIVIPGKPQIIQ